nr:VOC family protein [Geodermatophilaceae bacterium]
MTDSFDTLRLPPTAVAPAPAFTARLRARLERALTLPRGVSVSTATADESATAPASALGAAIPYLAVADAPRAIQWYVDVLGARVVGEPIVMPDGRVGHCELALAGGTIYLAEEHPEIGVVAPDPAVSAVSLMLGVADADATRAAVLSGGGGSHREPSDGYGQRTAWVVDPFGHRWGLHSPLPTGSAAARHGDLVYASLWVPETDRAAEFYSAVLGWTYHPDDGPSRQVANAHPAVGIVAGRTERTLFCCFAVDDVDAAAERVLAAGGSVQTPREEPYGRTVDCVDDQGTQFALNQTTAGNDTAHSGTGQGDIAYLTLLSMDSARFKDFYGAVLGWRFTPGSVEDGWEVRDVTPMTGLAGRSDRPGGVPMWRVEDIALAVARVRTGGGTASDPQQQHYGLMSECADDQGLRFYLGQ